jgi:phage-related protein
VTVRRQGRATVGHAYRPAVADMSHLTYRSRCSKPLVWLAGEVKTPPFSVEARREAGFLLRLLQMGQRLSLPESRPMPSIGPRCHELRVNDQDHEWRIVVFADTDAIAILEIFGKKTAKTPRRVIEACKSRLKRYRRVTQGEETGDER